MQAASKSGMLTGELTTLRRLGISCPHNPNRKYEPWEYLGIFGDIQMSKLPMKNKTIPTTTLILRFKKEIVI